MHQGTQQTSCRPASTFSEKFQPKQTEQVTLKFFFRIFGLLFFYQTPPVLYHRHPTLQFFFIFLPH